MLLAYVVVSIVGVGLLMIGGVYQVRRDTLESDPILIAACYVAGLLILGMGVVVPNL